MSDTFILDNGFIKKYKANELINEYQSNIITFDLSNTDKHSKTTKKK